MVEFARRGELIDLGTYLDIERLKVDQSPHLVSLGTMGPDGSWPSSEGSTFGAFVELTFKSLIWYPWPEFKAAGYAVPNTWDELIALSDRIVADGRTPWCQGFLAGDASGWPGTDWIEQLLLAGAGPLVYDRWTSHEIGFDSPPVREAFERLGTILFTPRYEYLGPHTALDTPFSQATSPMTEFQPPRCWLYHAPHFQVNWLPGRTSAGTAPGDDMFAFLFPAITERVAGRVLGGGSQVVAFADRPEVREVVKFLLSPKFGADLAGFGHGFLSPNHQIDLESVPEGWRGLWKLLETALAADMFRFDGSDLMPSSIGEGLFWDAMMEYVRKGPDGLNVILRRLDAAWPEGG